MTAPTAIPIQISTRWIACATPVSVSPGSRWLLMPTSTAARPTKLWRIATSSGIAVIATRRATTAPTRPPTARHASMTSKRETRGWSSVAPIASAMPTNPNRFP